MEKSFITTAFDFEGCKIIKNMGIVRGIVVRSRNFFANIGAGFQTLVGGDITLYTELCEKTRLDAFELMVKHAEELGANAIIGMRYDANEVMSGVTEVLAYGTAVVVERV
ncbi:MAG: YbjQ family protein [Ignavibacteria bacterium]|nr:YbjQ family protein [Ignavibacteria bacterium]MBK7254960.1 YbjQ family protein [Ignavibacteria bacterium]MBK7444828.1 YbjQ family protein [Ignavibacteria bacterium]